jgi:signal transduction histidine kinase
MRSLPPFLVGRLPLDDLPVAAAGLDGAGAILGSNARFQRLFRLKQAGGNTPRLPDLVTTGDRGLVERALDRLRQVMTCRRRRLIAAPAVRPPHPLTIDILREPDGAEALYLVLARPALGRSQLRAPQGARALPADGRDPLLPAGPAPYWLTALAHELRGSLSAIHGWAAMAERGALPAGDLPRALRIIRRNAESLSALVESVLDVSRTTQGALALAMQPVDLAQVAAFVVDSASPAARERQVALSLEAAAAPVVVEGDRLRLEQVIRNLVDNAIKFTPAGGTVRVRVACHASLAECVVEDTGAGIPADVLPALFDPARRRTLIWPPSTSGVGLGLVLVRELVRLHHGDVHAESEGVGLGSTFVVRLPLAPRRRSAA